MTITKEKERIGWVSTAVVTAAVLSIGILFGCQAPDTSTNLDSFIREADRDISREMRRNNIEGMGLAVVWDDGRSWTAGYGSAGDGREMSADTPMMLASVTKLFTAMAVMTLVEDGLVDLDDPIGTYVPAMSGYSYPGSPEPSVRDLLTHHGGLPSDLLKGVIYDGPKKGYRDAFMDQVSMIAAEPATEPPRQLAHYSNSGYLLLGALVAEGSGRPYADYVEQEILEPLGMESSGFLDPRFSETLSAGFAEGKETEALRMTGLPEGGLAASAGDLAAFMEMILKGGLTSSGESILAGSTLKEMMRRQNSDIVLDFDFTMGLGFHLMDLPGYPGVRVAWHDGGTHPFAATLLVAPDHGVGVALVSNTDENVPFSLAHDILAKAVEEKTGESLQKSRTQHFGSMPGRILGPDEITGTYASEIGALVVGGRPGNPTLRMMGMEVHLVPKESDSYGIQVRIAGILPLPISGLAGIRVVFREIDTYRAAAVYDTGKFRSIALAVEPETISSEWEDRFGEWTVVNPDPQPFVTSCVLGVDEEIGFMTVSVTVVSIPEPIILPVLSDGPDRLLTAGLGRHMGEILSFVEEDGQERLSWAGLELELSE